MDFCLDTDWGAMFCWSPLNFASRTEHKHAAATQFKPLFIRHHPSIYLSSRSIKLSLQRAAGLKHGRFSLAGSVGCRTVEFKACWADRDPVSLQLRGGGARQGLPVHGRIATGAVFVLQCVSSTRCWTLTYMRWRAEGELCDPAPSAATHSTLFLILPSFLKLVVAAASSQNSPVRLNLVWSKSAKTPKGSHNIPVFRSLFLSKT